MLDRCSFHEIAMWDLSKMIDYALEYTDQKTLYYIGHSMGTTAGFILLAQRPEYNYKIHFFIALAPVAIWKRPPNPLVESMTINGVEIKVGSQNSIILQLLCKPTKKENSEIHFENLKKI